MQWTNQLKAFSDSYRVIAYDVRGHGNSDAPYSNYDMPEAQHDLDTLLEKLHVERPFILAGHSFGGAIVTEFAHRRPDMLSHLVLIATTGEYSAVPWRGTVAQPATGRAASDPQPGTQAVGSGGRYVLKRVFFRNMNTWNGWSMFRDLSMPVLVIWANVTRYTQQRPLKKSSA